MFFFQQGYEIFFLGQQAPTGSSLGDLSQFSISRKTHFVFLLLHSMSDDEASRAGNISAEVTPAKPRSGGAPSPHDDRATVAESIKASLAEPCPAGFKYLLSKLPIAKWGTWGVVLEATQPVDAQNQPTALCDDGISMQNALNQAHLPLNAKDKVCPFAPTPSPGLLRSLLRKYTSLLDLPWETSAQET